MKSETAKILFEWVSVHILFVCHHCSCCWCSRELVCSCFIVRVDLLSCTTMYTGSSFFVLWLSPLILVLDSSCRIFCLCWGHHMSLLLWLILVNAVRLVRLSLVLVIVFSCCGSCVDFRVGLSCCAFCLLPVLGSSYVITFVVDTRGCRQTCVIVFVFDVRSVFVVLLNHLKM